MGREIDTKTKHIHVKSVAEAWATADRIFPTDYIQDPVRSEGAGYPIYVTTDESRGGSSFCWISDLNDRLELNLPNCETVNVWIDPAITYEDLIEVSRSYGYLA